MFFRIHRCIYVLLHVLTLISFLHHVYFYSFAPDLTQEMFANDDVFIIFSNNFIYRNVINLCISFYFYYFFLFSENQNYRCALKPEVSGYLVNHFFAPKQTGWKWHPGSNFSGPRWTPLFSASFQWCIPFFGIYYITYNNACFAKCFLFLK